VDQTHRVVAVNVVLYVADSLRADHVSCYGYERSTTPSIDAMAENGVRFQRCFAPATWTRPVAGSLLTGAYPPAHSVRTREDTLRSGVPVLPERFRREGYETLGVTSMGNVSSTTGFSRGFDRFVDVYKDEAVIERRRTSTATDEELQQESAEVVAIPRAEDLNRAAVDLLADRGEDPFFLFVWSIDPHTPFDPPEGFREYVDPDYDGEVDGSVESLKAVSTEADLNHLRNLYDGEIAYNDRMIGDLVDHLASIGELSDTLFLVVGDHGEAFREHERLGHGHSPYDELVHVPAVARTPAGSADGHSVDELVSLVDVAPTLLDYAAGVDPDQFSSLAQGVSVAPALSGGDVDGHEAVFTETTPYDMQNSFYSVRTDRWKYIEIEEPVRDTSYVLDVVDYVREKRLLLDILRNPLYYLNRYWYSEDELLFDLDADPGERENLVGSRPEVADRFREQLRTWVAESESLREVGEEHSTIDDETIEQLQRLGYTE